MELHTHRNEPLTNSVSGTVRTLETSLPVVDTACLPNLLVERLQVRGRRLKRYIENLPPSGVLGIFPGHPLHLEVAVIIECIPSTAAFLQSWLCRPVERERRILTRIDLIHRS